MKGYRVIVFLALSFLLLFYPGNWWMTRLFSNRTYWNSKEKKQPYFRSPIPQVSPLAPYPVISAEGVYVADLESFTPLFEQNSQTTFYPASTTKIITALVTIDLYKPEDILTIQREIKKEVQPDWQLMGLVANERISVENLLYGILVHSANDAAINIAVAYGEEQFIKKMNEKALSIGMKSTQFKNPDGIDEVDQYTTPYDLALAARELLKNPYLVKFVSTKEITISDVDYKYFHRLSNVNRLLGEVPGIGGLKTGYTELAGQNLVSFYKQNGHQYIFVVMKSMDRFADTITLTQWVNANISYIPMPLLQ